MRLLTGGASGGTVASMISITKEAAAGIALDHHQSDQTTGRTGGFWIPAARFDERWRARAQSEYR